MISASAAVQPPPSATSIHPGAAITAAFDRGAYDDAERTAGEWLAQARPTVDPLERARALDALTRARLKNGNGGTTDALRMADEAVSLKEAAVGAESALLIVSLLNKGGILGFHGRFRDALAFQARALAIALATSGPESPQSIEALLEVARSRIALKEFDAAERDVSRVLSERERDEAPLALARALEVSGLLHRDTGRYPQAAAELDRALDIWNRVAPAHPDRSGVMQLRGDLLYIGGEITAATNLAADAYQLAKQALRPDHPQTALMARTYGRNLFALGDLVMARRLSEEALEISRRSLPRCNPDFADALNSLATSRRYDGDYEAAMVLRKQHVDTIAECFGPRHVDMATALYNQFSLYDAMGSYADADRLAERALRIWRDTLGPDHPFLAFGLNGWGESLVERRDYIHARALFEQALRIRRATFGEEHPAVAGTLLNLSRALAGLGQSSAAERLLGEAIASMRNGQAWQPDAMASALHARATFEQKKGDYAAAQRTLTEVLVERQRVYGPSNPMVAADESDLAANEFALGSTGDALIHSLNAEAAGLSLLRFNMRLLPERRALELAAARPRGLDIALSIAASDIGRGQTSADALLDAVVHMRGVVLDELGARARMTSNEPSSDRAGADLATARARYATLLARAATGESVNQTLFESARLAKEDAESSAAAKDASTRRELANANAGVAELRQALPDGAALISYIRYQRTTVAKTDAGTSVRRSPAYLAFVVTGAATTMVPLASANAVDRAIAEWRTAIEHGPSAAAAETEIAATYLTASSRVRRLIWDPVVPSLRNAVRVFVVPDGALNVVNFAALTRQDGRFLIERGPRFHYLTTERDVLAVDPAKGSGILAVGGPSYGKVTVAAQPPGCLAALTFGDLPAAAAEARAVARLASLEPATVLTGEAASKLAILQSAPGRRIVHLATHGFFLESGCSAGEDGRRGVGGLVRSQARSRSAANPLRLAGLAFAGANIRKRTGLDLRTLMTSEDVVSLQLRGTEWVVLSACDTGLGEFKSGEGVFGLRRAFQIAGARTVIMSLWSVEDESAGQWMRALYDSRFRRGLTTIDAVHAATLRMLDERRRAHQSVHPFYWAGFVAAGDWR